MPRPFIPVVNGARFEVAINQAGGVVENVFHLRNSAEGWTLTSLEAVCLGFADWLGNRWRECASGDCEVIRITGQDISEPGGHFFSYVPPVSIVGTALGNPQPRSVTVAMKWDTGFAGRSYRGRTFHIGLPTNFLNTANHSLLSTAGRTALVTRYALLQDDIQAQFPDCVLVVVSYMQNGLWLGTGISTPISSVSTDFRVDTMRKRMDAVAP